MKNYLLASLLFLGALVSAQENLQPNISDKPDISKEAQAKYAVLKLKYEAILKKQEKGTLTAAETKWLQDNEMKVVDGDPFSTLLELDPDSWGDIPYMKDVTSSSKIKASASTTYEVSNTRDFDLRTAWAANKNNGVDQKITFTFNPIDGIAVTYIEIYNGYQKSETAWKNNSRAKKIEVCIGGEPTYILNLEDTIKMQRFDIKDWPLAKNADLTMEFRILEVYAGDKYRDLCISEIDFGGTGN